MVCYSEELRGQKAKLIADGRKIVEKAKEEKRLTLSAEEDAVYGKIWKDVEVLDKSIETWERQEAAERELAAESNAAGRFQRNRPANDSTDNPDAEVRSKSAAPDPDDEAPDFRDWRKRKYLAPESRRSKQYRAGFRGVLNQMMGLPAAREDRALGATLDVEGGFTYASETFINRLLKAVDDQVFIRQLATVIPVLNADSLGVPTLSANPAALTWGTELETGTADSTMAFGKRELHPHPNFGVIYISKTLGQRSALPGGIEALVADRFKYVFGTGEEQAFLTGTGNGRPLGLMVADNRGISTGRDVSTDNTTTAMTPDGLKNAKYALKGAYWSRPSTRWIFHRDGVKQISKFVGGDGQYLWQPGLTRGEPDQLLQIPVIMSEFMSNTFTTGLYVGLLGDLEQYWIADAMTYRVQIGRELRMLNNQDVFVCRAELDAMPVLEEAFVRVKLA